MAKLYTHIKGYDKPTYVLGDLHGEINTLKRAITDNNLSNCNIIVAGDIGLGFSTRSYHINEYGVLNKFLFNQDIHLYMLRGNHDDPSYFNRKPIEDEFFLSNVKVVPDYTLLSINEHNILLVGGATSIDRMYRINSDMTRIKHFLAFYPKMTLEYVKSVIQPSYWENEQPFLNTDAIDEITEDGFRITNIVTHTAPTFAYPLTKNGIMNWLKYDSNLSFDIDKERGIMDAIYQYLIDKGHKITEWSYGHFHYHYQEIINDVKFTLLYNIDRKFDLHEICRKTE